MTASPAALRALLERLEAAEKGCVALDQAIVVDLLGQKLWEQSAGVIEHGDGRLTGLPDYTSSLSQAVKLCERVLPGRRWAVMRWGERDGKTVYMAEVIDGPGEDCDEGPTPALALCRAIVTVKLAESGGE